MLIFLSDVILGALIVWVYRNTSLFKERMIRKDIRQNLKSFPEYDYKTRKTSHNLVKERVGASLIVAHQDSRIIGHIEGSFWACGFYDLSSKNSLLPINRIFTIIMMPLNFQSPHLYFDNKANNAWLRRELPIKLKNAGLVSYEGVMQQKYGLYAPIGYHIDSLVIGAPDLLDAINKNSKNADIEILGNQLYFIIPGRVSVLKDLPSYIAHMTIVADELDDNLSRYLDKHSSEEKIKSRRLTTA